MKSFFLATLAALILLSLVAWSTKPRPADPSKVQLIWSSDDNPTRYAQIDLFNEIFPRNHLQLDPDNAEPEKVIVQSLAGVGLAVLRSRGDRRRNRRHDGDAQGRRRPRAVVDQARTKNGMSVKSRTANSPALPGARRSGAPQHAARPLRGRLTRSRQRWC